MAHATWFRRELVRLAAGGLVSGMVWFGCSSPASTSGAGGESPLGGEKLADNPFRDPREVPTRDQIVEHYFRQRGLEFNSAAEASWVALDGQAAILATIRNGGTKRVQLVAERTHGIWPFRDREHACVRLSAELVVGSLQAGVQVVQATERFEAFETIEVPPGAERTLRVPFEIPLPAGIEAAVVTVEPVLHPLALLCGDEPERLISIAFPAVKIRFAPAAVVAAAIEDEVPLTRALADIPEHVIGAALRRGEADREGTIDLLVLALPGPDPRSRRARFVALEWLTGERLGNSVERWRSWWESAGKVTTAGTRVGQ